MHLPRISPPQWRLAANVFVKDGILPSTTLQERNQAQAYINANCHGLAQCAVGASCDTLRARGERANTCAHARFTVRSYYVERNIPENGDHQAAIVHDDGVAQGCMSLYQQNCH
jgi:hypothetical protein